MKMKRLWAILLVLLLSAALITPCNAIATELETEELDEERIAELMLLYQFERVDEQNFRHGFHCYSVNERGDYALGFDLDPNAYIQVYDAQGNYLYGYQFDSPKAFGIVLKNESFVIYTTNIAIHLSENGDLLDMKLVPSSAENLYYRRNVITARKQIVNECVYMAEHSLSNSESILWSTYTRLVRTDADGKVTVLCEGTDYLSIVICCILSLPVVLTFVGGIVILHIVRKRKKERKTRQAAIHCADNQDI